MVNHSLSLRLAALAALAGLVACTDNAESPTATSPAQTTTTVVHDDDGVLLLGLVVPRIGAGAEVGLSVRTAVTLAVTEINEEGGVNGQKVRVVIREEGDDPATTVLAMQDLVQLDVDAIIGPTSSVNTLGSLDVAVDAGVLTCSPTASALALDAFPDNGLFLRTMPSDSLQASAIARLVDDSGNSTAVVVYLDDPYGRPFAEEVRVALRAEGTGVTDFIGFTASEDSLAATVEQVVEAQPGMVVVIADDTTGPAVITAIDAAADSLDPSYVVNDSLRRPAAAAQPFGQLLAERIQGVSPRAYAGSTVFTEALQTVDPDATGLFAHNAYNCVNLIALAAQSVGTVDSSAITAAIPAITIGGTSCASFPECSTAMADGRNIDYDGPTGVLSIGSGGDPVSAVFEVFGFDATGRDVAIGTLVVGVG